MNLNKLPKNCNDCAFLVSQTGAELHPVCIYHEHDPVIITNENELLDSCPIKDEVLTSQRHRVMYRGEKFYIVVAFKNNKPWEVFAEHPTSSEHSLHYMLAGWDLCTRLTSMALQTHPLPKVLRQMERSSRQLSDLPDILGSILRQYLEENKNGK